MKNIEVLIVEDDRRIAEIHRRFIEKIDGFSCIGMAFTGKEAEEWIAIVKPDLVLLDVYLPDMLGTQFINRIHNQNLDTDIILITAASESDIVKKAFRGGVTDYILKPLTFDKFQESLLTYRKKREIFLENKKIDEQAIQLLWNKKIEELPYHSPSLPKGIDPITSEKIMNYLLQANQGITAEKMGKQAGVSRSTARRYLEYLVSIRKAKAELIYGSIGRPERRYFPKNTRTI
ncbi:response regulator [Caldifermentibacillus hisashii]|jgi:two-component system CitB family response regulator|uniref:response regulator transcription factor n=1 Tax=Bacillaceae TaxID=186817 RepID=UPI0022E46FE0|nr:response regulator [Caldibacillus thermoamylovorans]